MATLILAWISAKYNHKFEGLFVLTAIFDFFIFILMCELMGIDMSGNIT